MTSVRAACLGVFTGRAKQPWPPEVTLHPGWDSGYRQLAEATHYPVTNAAGAVRQLIKRIDQT